MLSLKESLKILRETNALIEGHFILSSGLHSPKYIQCAQLMSKPNKAIKICESLASKIQKEFNASVSGIGANVDPVSQTIQLKGTITNASPALLPGMSGRVVF